MGYGLWRLWARGVGACMLLPPVGLTNERAVFSISKIIILDVSRRKVFTAVVIIFRNKLVVCNYLAGTKNPLAY